MSKAIDIYNSNKTKDEKLIEMKKHFHKCADYTDKTQTLENTQSYFKKLKEILDLIVKLQL